MGGRARPHRSGVRRQPRGAVSHPRPPFRREVKRMADGIQVKALNAGFGALHMLPVIGPSIPPVAVTAIIGPSGCGKSTFVRCLSRMHEVVPGARVSGAVMLDSDDLYAPDADPVEIRRRVGMVFQKP